MVATIKKIEPGEPEHNPADVKQVWLVWDMPSGEHKPARIINRSEMVKLNYRTFTNHEGGPGGQAYIVHELRWIEQPAAEEPPAAVLAALDEADAKKGEL